MSKLDDIRLDLAQDFGLSTELTNITQQAPNGDLIPSDLHEIRVKTHYWQNKLVPDVNDMIKLEASFSNEDEGIQAITILASTIKSLIELETFRPKMQLELAKEVPTRLSREPILSPSNTAFKNQDEMLHIKWGYVDSISVRGKTTVSEKLFRSVSFRRWQWHGKHIGSPVTLSRMGSVNADWGQITYNLAQDSLQAYEDFPTSIPRMSLSGKLEVDTFATKLAFTE